MRPTARAAGRGRAGAAGGAQRPSPGVSAAANARPPQLRRNSGSVVLTPVRSARRGSSGSRDVGSSSARTPVSARKSTAQLQHDIERLEGIVRDRRLFFEELVGEEDALVRMLGSDAADIVPRGTAEDRPSAPGAAPPMTEEEEIAHLARRNAQLTRELRGLQEAERRYANDPAVLDKRNEVRLVKMEIERVEREVETLQTVKRRRNGALRAIDRTEQKARLVRGLQREVTTELRAELKALMEKLRTLEREDLEVHARHARLQEQVKLGVSEKAVEELRATIAQQEEELKELVVSEAEWKRRKEGAHSENQRLLVKEQKECLKLEQEVERLRALLIQEESALRKSYQPVSHYGRS